MIQNKTQVEDFEIKSKIYSLNLRLVLNHILYSQDVLSFWNLFFTLGSVHYLYPGLVPKRNGLGKPFFWGMKGWVNIF